MQKKPAERLLPHTQALPRGTIEMSHYRTKILVRYRRLDGHSFQKTFASTEEADKCFSQWFNELYDSLPKKEAKTK